MEEKRNLVSILCFKSKICHKSTNLKHPGPRILPKQVKKLKLRDLCWRNAFLWFLITVDKWGRSVVHMGKWAALALRGPGGEAWGPGGPGEGLGGSPTRDSPAGLGRSRLGRQMAQGSARLALAQAEELMETLFAAYMGIF